MESAGDPATRVRPGRRMRRVLVGGLAAVGVIPGGGYFYFSYEYHSRDWMITPPTNIDRHGYTYYAIHTTNEQGYRVETNRHPVRAAGRMWPMPCRITELVPDSGCDGPFLLFLRWRDGSYRIYKHPGCV
jgi:hypothetical protein